MTYVESLFDKYKRGTIQGSFFMRMVREYIDRQCRLSYIKGREDYRTGKNNYSTPR